MDKAIKLYEMMAARFEKTGWSPCQAAIYAEMAEFMRKECSSLEDAAEKLKTSHLYTAPSVALMKDMILALIRAAEDDEIAGMADVYRQKLDEIERDPAAVYDAAYLTAAHNIYTKHCIRISTFQEIYLRYLDLENCYETEILETNHLVLRMAFENLERYGGDFAECAKRPEFREVVLASDAGYERFVRDAQRYRSNPPDIARMIKNSEKRADDIWSRFNKDDIAQKASTTKAPIFGACLIVAPPDEHGDYEYTEVEIFKGNQP